MKIKQESEIEYQNSSIEELLKGKLDDIPVKIEGFPKGIVNSVDYKNYLFRLRYYEDLIECRGKSEIRGMSAVSLLKLALEEDKLIKLYGIFKDGRYFEVHSVQYNNQIQSNYF